MWQTVRLLSMGLREKAFLREGTEAILARQRQRLKTMVAWAKANSPYYAEQFRGIDPERFELSDLPTLTKPAMMANFDQLVTEPTLKLADLEAFVSDPARLGQWYRGQYALSRTSGTQGLKAMIVQDRA